MSRYFLKSFNGVWFWCWGWSIFICHFSTLLFLRMELLNDLSVFALMCFFLVHKKLFCSTLWMKELEMPAGLKFTVWYSINQKLTYQSSDGLCFMFNIPKTGEKNESQLSHLKDNLILKLTSSEFVCLFPPALHQVSNLFRKQ